MCEGGAGRYLRPPLQFQLLLSVGHVDYLEYPAHAAVTCSGDKRVFLIIGSRLGPYEIVAPLGAGGMSEVYRARDTRLDRVVAIKGLSEHVADDAGRRARSEREARLLSQVHLPHMRTLCAVC